MGRHGAPRAARGRARYGRATVLGIASLLVAGAVAVAAVGPDGGDDARREVAGSALSVVPLDSFPDASGPVKPSGGVGDGAAAGKDGPGGEDGPGEMGKPRSAGRPGPVNAAHRESIPRTPSAATAAAAKLVDEARAEAGCEPLTVDPALAALAAGHSKDMALDGYFGHQGPDGAPLVVRAARSGAPAATAENIARGPADPQALMNMWMARPGARANILNCGFHSMGLGAYFNGSGFWWTGDFAA